MLKVATNVTSIIPRAQARACLVSRGRPHLTWMGVSRLKSPAAFHFRSSPRDYTTMASPMNDIAKKLGDLSIKPVATLRHQDTTPASWSDALIGTGSAPASFQLIKTLVYKSKAAKDSTPIPIVVIVREGTEMNSGLIGKKLNLKELRLAPEDLLTQFFSVDKNSRK